MRAYIILIQCFFLQMALADALVLVMYPSVAAACMIVLRVQPPTEIYITSAK